MRIKIIPTREIDNQSDISLLLVSYKNYESMVNKFKELEFEVTEQEPEHPNNPSTINVRGEE